MSAWNRESGEAHRSPALCLVASLYHPNLGGPGRQAVGLSERLAHLNVPLFVIARQMEGVSDYPYDPKVEVSWVRALRPKVHILEEKSLANLMTSLTFSFGALYRLWKRRREYELAHFFGASVPLMICLLPLLWMRKRVIAVVAAAVGTEAGSLRGRYGLFGVLLMRLVRKVHCFVAISSEIEQGLREEGISPGRIVRIPIFVEENFRPATSPERERCREELGLPPFRWVAFSGRFVPRKGLDVLLKAWPGIQREVPDARLLVLGDGPERPAYQNLVSELGLKESVEFRGTVADVAAYLRASDLFVFPSFHEGLPGSLLEAMACGLPVVASRINGVMDVIQPEANGLLFSPGSVEELGRLTVRLLKNPEEARKLGRAAAGAIRKGYSVENVADSYLELYRRLCAVRGE